MNSIHLGWSPFFENQLASGDRSRYSLGRILEERKNCYVLLTEDGRELLASIAGKLRHEASGRGSLPTVGDWVCVAVRAEESRATIHRVLERRTTISRKSAGYAVDEQVLAANVDTVLLVTSLNQDLNLRRIERYLALVAESGARPVLLLTKADLCEEWANAIAKIERVAPSVPVHVVSALEGRGLEALAVYLAPGQTSVLLGSSGVGKSTLVNRLLGEDRQEVRDIWSHDGRGRHATSARQLLFLPGGGMLVDSPGLRELQLWIADEGLGQTFPDVEEAATHWPTKSVTTRRGTSSWRERRRMAEREGFGAASDARSTSLQTGKPLEPPTSDASAERSWRRERDSNPR